MADLSQVRVSLDLTWFEASAIRSALHKARRKIGQAKRRDFTPEPGRIDVNDAQLAMLDAVFAKLDAAMDAGLAAAKGGA